MAGKDGAAHGVDERERLHAARLAQPQARREKGAERVREHGGGAEAVVGDSSDPALVGITISDRFRPRSSAGLAYFVDQSIAAAIELFEQVNAEVLPAGPGHEALRAAG